MNHILIRKLLHQKKIEQIFEVKAQTNDSFFDFIHLLLNFYDKDFKRKLKFLTVKTS